MLIYYLISLAGEQLAKSGAANPVIAIWLPFLISLMCGLMLLRPRNWGGANWLGPIIKGGLNQQSHNYMRDSVIHHKNVGIFKWPIFKGLLDRTVLLDLTRYYIGTFAALTFIFLVFTLFELLRYIVVNAASGQLVLKYLIFLLPLVSMTVAPMSMLLTVLITYSVMMRRSEIIAWWGSGQSIYRIVTPALIFAVAISFGFWALQERVMPATNRRQNQLRAQIKGRAVTRSEAPFGRQWLASENTRRIYAYTFDANPTALKNPVVFEFDSEGVHLLKVWWSAEGAWSGDGNSSLQFPNAQLMELREGQVISSRQPLLSVEGERADTFKPMLNNPAEMSSAELSAYIGSLKARQVSSASLSVALERKRASLLDPLVMALIGAPASLMFGRRSAVVALCAAVMLGVIFWGASSVFSHFGVEGMLPAKLAAWGPSFLFSIVGLYLLLRVRT
jgi:LPS export ABC transporter permease LptG